MVQPFQVRTCLLFSRNNPPHRKLSFSRAFPCANRRRERALYACAAKAVVDAMRASQHPRVVPIRTPLLAHVKKSFISPETQWRPIQPGRASMTHRICERRYPPGKTGIGISKAKCTGDIRRHEIKTLPTSCMIHPPKLQVPKKRCPPLSPPLARPSISRPITSH